ncbi:MAG: indole-3-glycerol phosphate synthase TrpC [Deinococcota bacterium]
MSTNFQHEVSPLSISELETVPGVLGDISRERATDYTGKPTSMSLDSGLLRPSLFEALSAMNELSIIAEVKQKSPSKGNIAKLDPVEAASAYYRGGASAISVLTELRHFGGKLSHLEAVSRSLSIPTLRKDFVAHPLQLFEAKQVGASAVLLIVAVLKEHTAQYVKLAERLELDALVEVHDAAELDVALAAGASIIGVNNRDLRTLEIDLTNAPKLIARAKSAEFKGLLIAESGYRTDDDLDSVRDLADGVLIGTSLAGSGDLEAAVRALV